MPDTLQLSVTDMACGGCETAIKRAVGKLPGVASVTADHQSGRVEVTFDSAALTPASIRSEIEAIGYTVGGSE